MPHIGSFHLLREGEEQEGSNLGNYCNLRLKNFHEHLLLSPVWTGALSESPRMWYTLWPVKSP